MVVIGVDPHKNSHRGSCRTRGISGGFEVPQRTAEVAVLVTARRAEASLDFPLGLQPGVKRFGLRSGR